MMPASVCRRTHKTLANSSVRNVSIDVIFTVGLLPAGWFLACFFGDARVRSRSDLVVILAPRSTSNHTLSCNISQYVLTGDRPARQTRVVGNPREIQMARRKSALELVRSDKGGAGPMRNRINLFELA